MTNSHARITMPLALSLAPLLAGCSALGISQTEHGLVAFDLSPDGKRIVFSAADADLYLLDLNKSLVTRLTNTEILETAPVFAPDGKTVAYSAGTGGKSADHIFTLDLTTLKTVQLTSGTSTSDASPAYSADGTRLVFARAHRIRPYSMGGWTADQYDACIVSKNGGKVQRISNANYYGQSRPQFLDKNNLIYGASGDYPDSANYLMTANITTGKTIIITPKSSANDNYLGSDADVSPDGKNLVFVSDRIESYSYDLFTMNSGGGKATSLGAAKVSGYNQNPVWTPDGKNILFLAGTSSNAGSRPIFDLWQIGADGKNSRRIASRALFDAPMKWKKGA